MDHCILRASVSTARGTQSWHCPSPGAPGRGAGFHGTGNGNGKENGDRQAEEKFPLSWRCDEQESALPAEDNRILCGRAGHKKGDLHTQQLVLGAPNLE